MSHNCTLPTQYDEIEIPLAGSENNPKGWLTPSERKVKRAYKRFYLGFDRYGKTGKYIFMTLTSPPECQDIHKAWRKFTLRLKRRGKLGAYFAIKERNKQGTCTHLHVVMRRNHVPWDLMRQQWSESVGLKWCDDTTMRLYCHVERVKTRKVCNYIAKYLTKQIPQDTIQESKNEGLDQGMEVNASLPLMRVFWYSQDWICRAWSAISRAVKRAGYSITSLDYDYLMHKPDFVHFVDILKGRLVGSGWLLDPVKWSYAEYVARCAGAHRVAFGVAKWWELFIRRELVVAVQLIRPGKPRMFEREWFNLGDYHPVISKIYS